MARKEIQAAKRIRLQVLRRTKEKHKIDKIKIDQPKALPKVILVTTEPAKARALTSARPRLRHSFDLDEHLAAAPGATLMRDVERQSKE
ncbi:hypothetical protein [Streptacidiphilus sp. PAMC 29251]